MPKFGRTALALILAAVPAVAQELDTDGDGLLSRAEFDAGLQQAGLFDRLDSDASGRLGIHEFYGGVHDVLDLNDDGVLTEGEWSGASGWFGGDSAFGEWDADADGILDNGEVAAAAKDGGLYAAWGGENGIDRGEWYAGLYDTADYDADGSIDEDEDGWADWF